MRDKRRVLTLKEEGVRVDRVEGCFVGPRDRIPLAHSSSAQLTISPHNHGSRGRLGEEAGK